MFPIKNTEVDIVFVYNQRFVFLLQSTELISQRSLSTERDIKNKTIHFSYYSTSFAQKRWGGGTVNVESKSYAV